MIRLASLLLFLAACSTHHNASAPQSSESEKKTSSHLDLVKIHEPYPGLKIHEFQMVTNGMRVFLLPRKQNETIALALAYAVGSRNEEIGKTGLAHLFEHMMFRGTESYPDPFKVLTEWGGDYNAFTTKDFTAYHEVLPSNRLDEVLKFESERMRKLLITPQIFSTERGAVVSERKMNFEDSPMGRMYWEIHHLSYDKHPYKILPIGWQDDIDRASFEDALSFYNHYYAPDRATLTMVGDLDVDTTVSEIEKYFGNYPAANYADRPITKEPPHKSSRHKVVKLRTETALLADGVMGPTFFDPYATAEYFFCTLFADSTVGYLSHALVDTGVARSVHADCYPNHDASLSSIFITAVPGMSAAELEKKYNGVKRNFLKWLTPERFENSKIYFEVGQLESLRNPNELAQTLATNTASSGDPLYTFELVEKVKQLKLKDIEERFRAREKSLHNVVLIQPAAKSDPMKKEKTK